ncbi:cobalt ABC transporter ATPase [Bifidobacterium sp. DSM 109958]|uniref:Cobalt ABC transporter ATPase n=1 Tax=Bifidobacterium moraviense TaxID=2675323 RepID=A0A7Y0HZ50_9BIFI|nr:ABC transporter ATP-binding protein [Bifidobacterium sp. DSM 109958]NMN01072.1 cobalt ABC transporter ATPase [Bifidobacterium sp. DSM 109958]
MFGFRRRGKGGADLPADAAAWFSGDPIVELEHVDFAYRAAADMGAGTARPVLHDFSMTVRRGECVALLGPNGSGKTTIMTIVNALAFPDAGTYRLGGTPVERARVEARDSPFAKALHQRVGYVFQNAEVQLFCPSVREEIAFGPQQMGLPDAEVDRRVRDMAALFGLDALLERPPYQLSGGERKRVALACVMSMNPDLLVLDEPTDGLDERNTDVLVRALRGFAAAGKTVLFSTHHDDIVRELGARVVRLG